MIYKTVEDILCNIIPGFGIVIVQKKSALLDDRLSRLQKLHRMSHEFYDIMVIGEENSSVSNLIVQNIHTLSHISPSKHIYIQI